MKDAGRQEETACSECTLQERIAQYDLWSVIEPSTRDCGVQSPEVVGSRDARGAVRARRKIAAVAAAAAVCFSCALWTWRFGDASGSESAATVPFSLSLVDLKTGSNSDVLVHTARTGDSQLLEPLAAGHDVQMLHSRKAEKGKLDEEYKTILGKISRAKLRSSLLDSGSEVQPVNNQIQSSQLASQVLAGTQQDGVLESAHSALLTLKHQLADSSGNSAPTVRLKDAKLSVEKLQGELQKLRRSETSPQQNAMPDVVQAVANAITGQHKPDSGAKAQHKLERLLGPHAPESDVHDAIPSLFNDKHQHRGNATVSSNLTAEEQQIKSLASSVLRINSGMGTSHANTTAARDAVGVLKPREPGPSQHAPVRSIVIHVNQPGSQAATTAPVKGPTARLNPEHASKLRKVQLSHIPVTTDGGGKGLGDQSGKSEDCGCCGAEAHCSCCEKGWLGLQTFGKWLLMVLALVLCVMTFLIFGFMCFGCLWAWREFRRQDRWERFLDRTTGKGSKEETEKSPPAVQKASGAAGVLAQPPGNGAAGSSSGRPISRRADSQSAR